MNWEAIGATGELIGAFAVVITLIYVGIQVRHSAGAVRSAAANDASVALQTVYLALGSNRQASEVWFTALASPEPLSTHDEFQFMMMMHAVLLGMQNSYFLSQEGTLDADYREAITTAIVAIKDLPGMDRYWRQRRGFFITGFAEYVDSLLARDAIETLDMYKRSDVKVDQ
jgi:hypothetical protein